MSALYEKVVKNILVLENRVKLELMRDGTVSQAPAEYQKFGIRWLWNNRHLQKMITVQCVVSDVDKKIKGAWIEIEHKNELEERPMDSWAKKVYGEVLVYVSPDRGQAVIFATRKVRAAFSNEWKHYQPMELILEYGYAKGIVVPWEKFCEQGQVVTVQ